MSDGTGAEAQGQSEAAAAATDDRPQGQQGPLGTAPNQG